MSTKITTLCVAVVLLLVPVTSNSMEEKKVNGCKKRQKVEAWDLCDHDVDWSFDGPENICCKMFLVLEYALFPVAWPILWCINRRKHQKLP